MLSDLEDLIDDVEEFLEIDDLNSIKKELWWVERKISELEDDLKDSQKEVESIENKLDEAKDEIESLKEGGNTLVDVLKEEWWKEAKEFYTLGQLESVFGIKGNLRPYSVVQVICKV